MPSSTGGVGLLAPYQLDWLLDQSRHKLFLKARRIGGSYVLGLESAMRAAGVSWTHANGWDFNPHNGVGQNVISASHRQAKSLLKGVGLHLRWLEIACERELIHSETAETIRLKSGLECKAFAPNPHTARGDAGDVLLDEFGVMARSKEMWAAVKAITDPTLGRPQGYKLRIAGTPCGDDNMFHSLAETDAGSRFSKHIVSVHDAKRQGFPADIEALRDEAGDSDMFAQEYECVFLSAAYRYITAELYDQATYSLDNLPTDEIGPRYLGYDIARKSTGDHSALVDSVRLKKKLWITGVTKERGGNWATKRRYIDKAMDGASKMAADASGLGTQFVEELENRYGARVIPVHFTMQSKEILCTGFRKGIETSKVWLPDHDQDLKRAVLSIKRETTSAGNIVYRAPRKDGNHADEAWAAMLSVHAANSSGGTMGSASLPRTEDRGSSLSDYM